MALKYSDLHPGLVVVSAGNRRLRLMAIGPDKGSNIMILGMWVDAEDRMTDKMVSGLLTLADWSSALWNQSDLEPAP